MTPRPPPHPLSCPETTARRLRALDVLAEELDTVLMRVHTASEKHQLILPCNEHLANPVFEAGMDQAVRTLAQRVRLPGFRETLVMQSVHEALRTSQEPFVRKLQFGSLTQTPVKHVAQPLRHHRLSP